MRPILALALAAAALAAPSAHAATAATRSCGGAAAIDEKVSKIAATGTTCTAARRVVRAWLRSEECFSGQAEDCDALGYTCTERETSRAYVSAIACRRGAHRVTWRVEA